MELCKAKFREAYADDLETMAETYGSQPEICFGIVSDWW